ncbi:MAG: hypothetical protein QP780_08285 [Brevibacterium sp. UMB1308B]|nr:hypothetical protein [Brevibacterium sp. UMB1308B]
MKKLVLAPAVALVAGAIAFSGTPAFAAPTTECSNNTLNAKEGAQCVITLDADAVKKAGKVSITVSNLPEGAKIKSVDAPNSSDPSLKLATTVDELAKTPTFKVYGVDGITGDGETKNPNGDYTVTVTLENGTTVDAGVVRYVDKSKEASAPAYMEPKNGGLQYAKSFRSTGSVITYTNLEANKDFTWVLEHKQSGKTSTGTFRSNKDSKAGGSFIVKLDGADKMSDDELKGDYTVALKDESGKTLDLSTKLFIVLEAPRVDPENPGEGDQPGEEAAEYGLKVSPKELKPADFVNKDKGVQLTVTGLKPNEKFNYSVSKQDGGKVENLFKEVQANKDGVWSHTVYGIKGSNGLDGFLGTYKVTIKSEEGVLTNSFKVTNTPGKKDEAKPGDKGGDKDKGDGKNKGEAKGGDNNSGKSNNAKGNDGKSSNTLPRTGMELSGLIAGGALLTVGAATVLVTRRRTK